MGVKNLTSKTLLEDSPDGVEVRSKLLEYAWWMKKEGYAESTITRRTKLLKTLANRGAQLLDPENVKVTISRQESWAPKTKALVVEAYPCFLKMYGGTWKPPKYKSVRKLPFIPSEHEIDQLIAGCNRKTAASLQLLKETGMRSGEAWMLKWIDFDLEKRTLRVTPEKGGNPRLLRTSDQLIAMVKGLHNDQALVFEGSHRHFARTYRRQRKRISFKLKNERIKEIKFHTLRHWKATMEYHHTKDILHVMKLLGHRNIQNTLLYTQLVEFEGEEFHLTVAESIDEARSL